MWTTTQSIYVFLAKFEQNQLLFFGQMYQVFWKKVILLLKINVLIREQKKLKPRCLSSNTNKCVNSATAYNIRVILIVILKLVLEIF